jgi:hypothetical protein
MPRFALALAASLAIVAPVATPVAADSLTVLLPTLAFPDTTVTTSTKGCSAPAKPATCQLAE